MIVDHYNSGKPRIEPRRRGEEPTENCRKSTQMNANAEDDISFIWNIYIEKVVLIRIYPRSFTPISPLGVSASLRFEIPPIP
jgi:hypothetical protein